MKILITGISGQDGIYLSRLLMEEYAKVKIIGVSRKLNRSQFIKKAKLKDLNNTQVIDLVNCNLYNYESINKLVHDFRPNLVFNLSGPSSVYQSISNPDIENDIKKIFNNITSSLVESNNFCKFFQASTSEMYGANNTKEIYDENEPFIPNSPYASGKLHCHKKVLQLAEKYNWDIKSGILFNHESSFRSNNYLIMKIINTAASIRDGQIDHLTVGSLDYFRDWSHAEDIVKGVFRITTEGRSPDYVLGSGVGTSIKEIVKIVFDYFDLNYKDYIKLNPEILRKNDPLKIIANPNKVYSEIGWSTKMNIENTLESIIDESINKLSTG
jgi:GDPmannose 4,6-dehydratase